MLQLYVLKLLELQSRYFGRQWRKNNMSIMSAIYQKVRHRLTDGWAYGNVVFKSAPILKRTLRVRHAMLQLYVLKLLELQSRYFGRQWRKNNMSIMSAIYQKVRHRLTDGWAYGNVVFKSAPILKRTLRVRHAMLQLYVLKLLELQSRYFGRQWRKNNMSIMSAIYQKVRHRLTDGWAYGNEMKTQRIISRKSMLHYYIEQNFQLLNQKINMIRLEKTNNSFVKLRLVDLSTPFLTIV
ncbi:unnamed protein product [Heterobilharzia americana]|nr:unnamed protein product [Heterobilharzia americana]